MHHHRIIKDKSADAIKSHGGFLQPLPSSASSVASSSSSVSHYHLHHHHHGHHATEFKNPVLPGLPRIDAGSEREQVSQLTKRVKELEKENFQLNHHVQQAEQSLRNYRELMANNLNKQQDPSASKSLAPAVPAPVVPVPVNNNAALLAQNVKELEGKLKDANKQIIDLTKQKSAFQQKLDEYL